VSPQAVCVTFELTADDFKGDMKTGPMVIKLRQFSSEMTTPFVVVKIDVLFTDVATYIELAGLGIVINMRAPEPPMNLRINLA